MKKIRALFLLVFMSFFISKTVMALPYVNLNIKYDGSTHRYSAEEVKLVVEGKELNNLTMPPIIFDGNTLVPAREVFEQLGAQVAWDNDKRQVKIVYENNNVLLTINDKIAVVNDNQLNMNVPAKIINDKTMIPLRFAAESVGLDVGWDSKTRVASINVKKAVIEPSTEITTENIKEPVIDEEIENTTYGQNINISTGSNNLSTKIMSITMPSESEVNFKINASSEIGGFQKTELPDGRLAIDIQNAENNVNQKSYTVSHPFVMGIRVAQFQTTPTMITRVVFDLQPDTKYNLTLSPDKKSIVLSFGQNNISDVQFTTNGQMDYIYITGNTAPSVDAYLLYNPDRLVIDMPYSNLSYSDKQFDDGAFVNNVRASQYDNNTARIVLDLKTNISYNISSNNNTTEIFITEPSYKNISYDKANRQFIINKDGNNNININNIVHKDEYLNKKYTLNLKADYSNLLGHGEIPINDQYLNSLSIQNVNNETILTINENQILAYTVTEDANKIYILVQLPKEKYKNIVVFDAGHGGHDNGASANGQIEKNLTLDIVNKTLGLLENDGTIKGYSSRITDVYPSFDDRTNLANLLGDIFISVHINSAGTNTKANGTEVYYLNPNDTGTGLTSNILAETIQRNLLNYLGSYDRKTKTENFIVLRQTNVPATLCEIGFITNPQEAANLGSDDYRMKVAQALHVSIREVFEKYPTKRY